TPRNAYNEGASWGTKRSAPRRTSCVHGLGLLYAVQRHSRSVTTKINNTTYVEGCVK
ncbi:hypothetical protein J6590_006443, partial [Homalodisca vitripennis]